MLSASMNAHRIPWDQETTGKLPRWARSLCRKAVEQEPSGTALLKEISSPGLAGDWIVKRGQHRYSASWVTSTVLSTSTYLILKDMRWVPLLSINTGGKLKPRKVKLPVQE